MKLIGEKKKTFLSHISLPIPNYPDMECRIVQNAWE
jgi:hypothetical protein